MCLSVNNHIRGMEKFLKEGTSVNLALPPFRNIPYIYPKYLKVPWGPKKAFDSDTVNELSVFTSRKHTYIILTHLNPIFIQ